MLCSLLSLFCIVGGVQIGPGVYKIELLNTVSGEIYEVIVPVKNDINF